MPELWPFALLAVVLAASFALADSALLAISGDSSPAQEPESRRAARERLHRALSMGRVLAYLGAGAALAGAGNGVPQQVAIAAVAIAVTVVLAEGTARTVGYALGQRALDAMGPFITAAVATLTPITTLGAGMDRLLATMLPPREDDDEAHEVATEQFQEVIAAESEAIGAGQIADEALIRGVFSMGDTEVHEVMVPRVDIVGIDAATPWSEVLDRVRSSEHARLPVYEDTLDNVVGILYAKDMLPAVVADRSLNGHWVEIVRPAVFIPPSKPIDQQLRDFQTSRTHIAIVSDEYGGTAGLLTIEDILEEIVGEIRDEYDIEEPDVSSEDGERYWVAGRASVAELAELLDTDFGVEDVATVGGLAYALFGRVPRPGDAMEHSGFRIVIERVRRRRIERVYFERLPEA